MSGDSPLGRLGARLERVLFGERATAYRRFLQAVFVTALGLGGAYLLAATGVVPVDTSVTDLLGAAAGLTVAVLVVLGIVEFVVLGRVYQRGTEAVAETAADLEQAAEHLEETAADLEETAETVEEAAETVEEAATDVEATDESQVTAAAREMTVEAKEAADAVQDDAAAAKRTATAIEVTAEDRRERLSGDSDGEETRAVPRSTEDESDAE